MLINTPESLPNWAFFIDKGRLPERGDFVVFNPPKSALITAHFGKNPAPFAKRALGMPGDMVTREGNRVKVNGETVATLKPLTKRGETLAPPSPLERVDMAREHARALVAFAGEGAVARMRKHTNQKIFTSITKIYIYVYVCI